MRFLRSLISFLPATTSATTMDAAIDEATPSPLSPAPLGDLFLKQLTVILLNSSTNPYRLTT